MGRVHSGRHRIPRGREDVQAVTMRRQRAASLKITPIVRFSRQPCAGLTQSRSGIGGATGHSWQGAMHGPGVFGWRLC
ncbi:hypothetical protein AAFF_G00203830 [Aldrovandia affinis]|uniref:Uncharacterized protein n=1 Tax=Aldrovandia affinis TaxID=143900 RepID=A0AAD7SX45_9TELE|nr:hypothetical protein AAFF_G00203830 [Aldrovandia affinis]